MKSEAFLIADFVSICEHKLTIVNTFDTIKSDTFPFIFRPFGVGYKLIADKREEGREYELTVLLRREGKTVFTGPPMKASFPKAKQNIRGGHIGALNLVGVTFEGLGTYIVELRTKQKIICQTELYVVKS